MTQAKTFYQQKISEGKAILAPMAGFSDAPFRKLCRDFGSAWAVSEMVSAKGLLLGDLKGMEISKPYPGEPDLVIQIFGGEPEIVAQAATKLYELYKPDAIDLNMGCPVKKITGKSCGSKLMQEPARAAAIVHALTQAVPIPISAKMRLGYDHINVSEVAKALEEAGASLIAIHGRTASQKYTGEANWETIKNVAEQLMIPVIGSGDISTKAEFDRYRSWGLGVMVARAAIGQPWIFAQLLGEAEPTAEEKALTAYKHALLHLSWYGSDSKEKEQQLMRQFRGQLLKYFDFLTDAKACIIKTESLADLETFIKKAFALDLNQVTTTVVSGSTPTALFF